MKEKIKFSTKKEIKKLKKTFKNFEGVFYCYGYEFSIMKTIDKKYYSLTHIPIGINDFDKAIFDDLVYNNTSLLHNKNKKSLIKDIEEFIKNKKPPIKKLNDLDYLEIISKKELEEIAKNEDCDIEIDTSKHYGFMLVAKECEEIQAEFVKDKYEDEYKCIYIL